MPVPRLLANAIVLGFLVAAAPLTRAAEKPHHLCLTKAEQRAVVASRRAVSLGAAIRSVRRHRHHSELLRARLCRRNSRLVYVLTLLGRSGKVARATIDASNGALISIR